MTISDFFNNIKSGLMPNIHISDGNLQSVIIIAMSRLNALYIDNNKNMYNATAEIDFFNASQNDFINSRAGTRWVGISPPNNFKAVKLTSCKLKEASPAINLPDQIGYIQDVPITIGSADEVNSQTPSANTGICSLRESTKLFNALTFEDEDSWTDVDTITALITYYRPIIIPQSWEGEGDSIDVLEKDVALVNDYVNQHLLMNATPAAIVKNIQMQEFNIIFNF